MPPRAASSISRIVAMTIHSPPYDSSISLCHLQIPPEPHRRRCKPAADRVMVLINLLLLVAGGSVAMLARSAPFVASVPVLGLCLNLSAGCFVALGLLGMVATTKLTGLLYLHVVLMTTLLVGTACTVGATLIARVDIARLVTADMFLEAPEPSQNASIGTAYEPAIVAACDYYANTTLLVGDYGGGGGGGGVMATDGTGDDVHAWERCWRTLGESHDAVFAQPPARYAVLVELCACVVLLLGVATAVCDLGLAATTEICMVGVEAIIVTLGSVETAFGVWVMLVAPSHSLGLFMLLLGSSNAVVGLIVAFWYTQCAYRFRPRMPFVPVAAMDPVDFARSRRRLRCALCLHLLLLLAFGTYTLQPNTLTSVRNYAYEFYCTHLPPGLIEVNAGPTSVLVARIRAVSADTAIASTVGLFSLCAAAFTVLLLGGISYYIASLAVEDRDSLL